MLQSIRSEFQKLDNIFVLADGLEHDDALRAHLAKYLCVLTSGLIENCVAEIFCEYTKRCSNANVQKHVNKKLRSTQNINKTRIEVLAGSFSRDWKIELSSYFEDNSEVEDALGSVVSNRHLIVHGGTVGLTHNRIAGWYKEIRRLITFLHDLVLT